MKTNTPATVFNRYRDENGRERWRRTILKDVFWISSYGAELGKNGFDRSSTLKCYIPSSVDAGGREYLPPSAYESALNQENYWSLGENDRLIKGAIETEYADIGDLPEDYILRPAVIQENDYGLHPHIKVIGR